MSQGNESETQQVVVIEEDENERKSYTVGLSESMGVSEIPPWQNSARLDPEKSNNYQNLY